MNLYVDNLNTVYENKEYMKTWITSLEALIKFIEGDKKLRKNVHNVEIIP